MRRTLLFTAPIIYRCQTIRLRTPKFCDPDSFWGFSSLLKTSSEYKMASQLNLSKHALENPSPNSLQSKRVKLVVEGGPHLSDSESTVNPQTDPEKPSIADVPVPGESNRPAGLGGLVDTGGVRMDEGGDSVIGKLNMNSSKGRGIRKKEKTDIKSRRGRRGTRNDDTTEESVQEGPRVPRLPKRQCALLIGFCGSGYSGMQIQPDHDRTIEGVLFQAMVRAGAVSRDNADNPVKIGLARAARTDAGVHAAGNLVSLKMITTVPDVPDMVARINEELPPEIRLWGYARVQNSFNARLVCDSRKYTYFFPSYLLIPPKPDSGLGRALREYVTHTSVEVPLAPVSFRESASCLTREEELVRKRAWRAERGHLENLRAIAQKFEGTHNFHNFTVARDFGDRSNQRHMKKIEVAEPVVYGETEWISVLFHGQSFMLHQRKMMAAMVLSCRTATPDHVIDELYGPRVVFIPKMPSLGLLLEEPIFESYNTRMLAINEKLEPSDPDYRPPINFDHYRDAINEFKEKYIYNNMRRTEDRNGLFDAWIRGIDSYAGNDLLYLNPKGAIPPAAVIKKGVRRENPFREKKKFDATNFSVEDNVSVDEDDDEDEAPIDEQDLVNMEG